MKTHFLLIITAFLLISCGGNKSDSDAFGNFEALDLLIGAEAQGKVLNLTISEGQVLKAGEVVGFIDTLGLYLKKEQLLAQKDAATARYSQIDAQIAVQQEQKQTLLKEKERFEKLVQQNAAPVKQLDDINGQLSVIEKQIASTKTQNFSLSNELKALTFQVYQINDQIKKSVISNPSAGTVLEKYIEAGEIASPGKAIYKLADLSVIKLKVYISGSQLGQVKLGQKVKVRVDAGNDEIKEYEGTISWISEQSEFTPKIIQTREERVNLVYAMKVDVVNDGTMKIGMPGEVKF